MTLRALLACIAVLCATACGSGHVYSPDDVERIRIGDSKASVMRKLGKPDTTTEIQRDQKNCVSLATWLYLGGKTGGAATVVGFDADDRVCTKGTSDGSKTSANTIDAQPRSATQNADIVILKEGRARGTVMLDEPDGVSVQLADGTTKRIPRAEIVRVDYATAAAPEPTPTTHRSRRRRFDDDDSPLEPPPKGAANALMVFGGMNVLHVAQGGGPFKYVDLAFNLGVADVLRLSRRTALSGRAAFLFGSGIGLANDKEPALLATLAGTFRFNPGKFFFGGGISGHAGSVDADRYLGGGALLEYGLWLGEDRQFELRLFNELWATIRNTNDPRPAGSHGLTFGWAFL